MKIVECGPNLIARRRFLAQIAASSLTGFSMAKTLNGAERAKKRQMTIDLVCGAIGVRANQQEAIELAFRHGFESVQPNGNDLGKLSESGLSALLDEMKTKNLVWGAAGLPVDFRQDQQKFSDGMKSLPVTASSLQRAGVTRVGTWLRPSHNSLTYVQNFRQHVKRLREVAKVLGDHGLRFGLEYVGPKTSWTSMRHSFIHTMAETKDLIEDIAQPNVGFVLDSWHWYTARETKADLLSLTNRDIVAVDLNDAPAGLEIDEQMDLSRELPTATGKIDLKIFLNVLNQVGYDGPVRAEPFNAALKKLPKEEAVASTAAAMKKAFALIE